VRIDRAEHVPRSEELARRIGKRIWGAWKLVLLRRGLAVSAMTVHTMERAL